MRVVWVAAASQVFVFGLAWLLATAVRRMGGRWQFALHAAGGCMLANVFAPTSLALPSHGSDRLSWQEAVILVVFALVLNHVFYILFKAEIVEANMPKRNGSKEERGA